MMVVVLVEAGRTVSFVPISLVGMQSPREKKGLGKSEAGD